MMYGKKCGGFGNNSFCEIVFDPPYSAEAGRQDVYAEEDLAVAHDVRGWCLKHGDHKQLRIALCGYAGEGHEELENVGWTVEKWKGRPGYGSVSSDSEATSKTNPIRERIWYSPHCCKSVGFFR